MRTSILLSSCYICGKPFDRQGMVPFWAMVGVAGAMTVLCPRVGAIMVGGAAGAAVMAARRIGRVASLETCYECGEVCCPDKLS